MKESGFGKRHLVETIFLFGTCLLFKLHTNDKLLYLYILFFLELIGLYCNVNHFIDMYINCRPIENVFCNHMLQLEYFAELATQLIHSFKQVLFKILHIIDFSY